MKKLISILFIFLILAPAFAELETVSKSALVGCDSAKDGGIDGQGFNQFDCEGEINSISCVGSDCSAICRVADSDSYCSTSECPSERQGGTCGYFNSAQIGFWGKLSTSELISYRDYDPCPYSNAVSANIDSLYCQGGTELLGFCFGGDWITYATFTCEKPFCLGTISVSTVSCTKTSEDVSYVIDVDTGAECDKSEQRCFGKTLLSCNNNNQWNDEGIVCSDICCDYVNSGGLSTCQKVDIVKTKGLCVSESERTSYYSCASEGDYQCNNLQVQKCSNGEWQNYETCSFGCNATATASGDNSDFCINHNRNAGGCTNWNTFCWKVGSDAFLYTCINNDWVLNKECASERCDTNSTACYDGCELWDEQCFGENNTCYYCNEAGAWIESGICQTEVNNITLECSEDISCTEDSKRCFTDWVISCENGNWLKQDQCTFGCSAGFCVTQDEQIFTPLMSFADFMTGFLPPIRDFIVAISIIGLFSFMLWRLFKWIGKPQ